MHCHAGNCHTLTGDHAPGDRTSHLTSSGHTGPANLKTARQALVCLLWPSSLTSLLPQRQPSALPKHVIRTPGLPAAVLEVPSVHLALTVTDPASPARGSMCASLSSSWAGPSSHLFTVKMGQTLCQMSQCPLQPEQALSRKQQGLSSLPSGIWMLAPSRQH